MTTDRRVAQKEWLEMNGWWWIPWAAVLLIVAGSLLTIPWSRRRRAERILNAARRQFRLRREWLEAKFVTVASNSGHPRGLTWVECEFENEAALARDRVSGQLRAFVAVTIRFAAVEGGPMEDMEAVGNRRAATAVFLHDGQQWTTDGRAIFNLNPTEAIEHFQHKLEAVE
jgi:hypothetical protein